MYKSESQRVYWLKKESENDQLSNVGAICCK